MRVTIGLTFEQRAELEKLLHEIPREGLHKGWVQSLLFDADVVHVAPALSK